MHHVSMQQNDKDIKKQNDIKKTTRKAVNNWTDKSNIIAFHSLELHVYIHINF